MNDLPPPPRSGLEPRIYHRGDSVVFLKTKEAFGGLSNMAAGYPLEVNGIHIRTAEALYQACRFPHLPDIQRLIIAQTSPMTAKMVGKPHRQHSRPDWNVVRVRIMRWCLSVKLAQHWQRFGDLLLETGNAPIVEESYRDIFWGAKPFDTETLVGTNLLGRLLTELRNQLHSPHGELLRQAHPPKVEGFLLLGQPIPALGTPPASTNTSKLGSE
jgi:type I restriction enzyme, S subunit